MPVICFAGYTGVDVRSFDQRLLLSFVGIVPCVCARAGLSVDLFICLVRHHSDFTFFSFYLARERACACVWRLPCKYTTKNTDTDRVHVPNVQSEAAPKRAAAKSMMRPQDNNNTAHMYAHTATVASSRSQRGTHTQRKKAIDFESEDKILNKWNLRAAKRKKATSHTHRSQEWKMTNWENDINGMVTRRISSWGRVRFFHFHSLAIRAAFSLSVCVRARASDWIHTLRIQSIRMAYKLDGKRERNTTKTVNIFCLIRSRIIVEFFTSAVRLFLIRRLCKIIVSDCDEMWPVIWFGTRHARRTEQTEKKIGKSCKNESTQANARLAAACC